MLTCKESREGGFVTKSFQDGEVNCFLIAGASDGTTSYALAEYA